MSMGEWRSVLASNGENLFETFLTLTEEEQYAALAQCSTLQKKYIYRMLGTFSEKDVQKEVEQYITGDYVGIGFGLGDGQEYEDGNFPLGGYWILVKDLESSIEREWHNSSLLFFEDLQDGGRRRDWGFKGDIENVCSTFDIWHSVPVELRRLANMAKDWCPISAYVVFTKDREILKFHTWQN